MGPGVPSLNDLVVDGTLSTTNQPASDNLCVRYICGRMYWWEYRNLKHILTKYDLPQTIVTRSSSPIIYWWYFFVWCIPVKKRDHDYITVISQTSHKCEVIIKTSQWCNSYVMFLRSHMWHHSELTDSSAIWVHMHDLSVISYWGHIYVTVMRSHMWLRS